MPYNSYEIQRSVQHILDNNPHDIKSIVHFYSGWNILNCHVRISLEDILTSNTWTTDEKIYLLDFFQYIFEYEDMTNLRFLLLYNVSPIDFALQFQNTNGAIAYLSSGGHLSTNSFALIKYHLTEAGPKSKIIENIYSKYSEQKEIDIIDYHNQQIQKIPLNDYLGYILAGDIQTTLRVLPKFKDDSPLLNKLLYYAVIEGDKNQIKLLSQTIYNFSFSSEETDVVIPTLTHPNFIKTAIQKNDINALNQLLKNDVDLNTTLLPPDKGIPSEKNTIATTPLTPLQYALETANTISLYDQENMNKRSAVIDYLYQAKSPSLETSSTYTQIIELFIRTGNIKKAQFYFDEAINKNIDLDFSLQTTKTEDNHYKYYIKHLPNYTKEAL